MLALHIVVSRLGILNIILARPAPAPCPRALTASRPNTKQQAEDGMHALSKFLYDRLFEYLVYRINKVLKSPVEVKCFIGVLDIFGFEMFNQVRRPAVRQRQVGQGFSFLCLVCVSSW